METRQQIAVPFEMKSFDDAGVFEGYASVFNVVDRGKDVVVSGAFARTISEHKASGTMPALLWQHDYYLPMGTLTDMVEDPKGLFVVGKIDIEMPTNAERYKAVKNGSVRGMSMGYVTKRYEVDKDTRVRKLLDVDLWDASFVTWGMNQAAGVTSIKGDGRMTERNIEEALREAGLSRSEAKAVVAHGYKGLMSQREVDEETASSAKRLLEAMAKR